MRKLKEWLEVGFTMALVLIGLIILLPVYVVATCANFAFIGARYISNVVAAMTTVSAISYAGYAIRHDTGLDANGKAVLIMTLAVVIVVGLWDLAAWALWRWKPDWLDAIAPDDDQLPPLADSKKVEGWLAKFDQRTNIIFGAVGVLLVVLIVALPFVLGMEGLYMILDGVWGIGLTFMIGALIWPVFVLISWLPRCRKRNFNEFFCAATRNYRVVIFGEVLNDNQEDDTDSEGAEANRQSDV